MNHEQLRLRRLGVDTYRQPIVFMRKDCAICRSEGFGAQSRVEVRCGDRSVIATLYPITYGSEILADGEAGIVADGEAGLSEEAWARLDAREGDVATMAHPPPLESFGHVRAKMFGQRLDQGAFEAIVTEIAAGRWPDIHIASFLTACAGGRLDVGEMTALTRAMAGAGQKLEWGRTPIVDKHCVGGLPGNRTTPIVVAIVAAHGLWMPKTSSRAITSPAGTADVVDTFTRAKLTPAALREVVEREGGCLAWGGGLGLSPVDDILIGIEHPLDIDSEGQLVASVLSKKLAAGSTHVLIDIPVGATAKVRSDESAALLARDLVEVGAAVGLDVRVMTTDGSQPVGRGLGPALEAHDVLAVLKSDPSAPHDLRDRALAVAARVLELDGSVAEGAGITMARAILDDGRAWRKLVAICEMQGWFVSPPIASHTRPVVAAANGRVASIDNRRLARLAKLSGAPAAPAAGLVLSKRVGDVVEAGEPLYTLHAETPGELEYAGEYARTHPDVVAVEEA